MDEITIKYDKISPRRQEINDRVQLLAASITIFLGYWDTLSFFTGIKMILPVTGFSIALLNILFVRFYKRLIKKYGYRFEVLILRINGIIMLTTGIGYHLTGSNYIQYAYFILTLCYFLILPYFILKVRKRRMLRFTPSKIIVTKLLRETAMFWNDIDFIDLQGNMLTIGEKEKRRKRKFYLEQDENKLSQINDFIAITKIL